MIDWYPVFLCCVIAVWLFAAPSDRNASRVILVATILSPLISRLFTVHIDGAWKLAIPGAEEVLTAMALMQWSQNRTGMLQTVCLTVALFTHVICYLDIAMNTDLVYSRYETILLLVAVAQILAFYETIARCYGLIIAWIHAIRHGRPDGVPAASLHHDVLPSHRSKILPTGNGTSENRK